MFHNHFLFVFQSAIAICMLVPPGSNFMNLVGFFSFAAWLFYGGSFAALLWLRRTRPNMERPYKVPVSDILLISHRKYDLAHLFVVKHYLSILSRISSFWLQG